MSLVKRKQSFNIMLVINHFIGDFTCPQTNCAAFIARKDFCVVSFCTVLIFVLGSNCGLAALAFVFRFTSQKELPISASMC